jgi:hypothetical protein
MNTAGRNRSRRSGRGVDFFEPFVGDGVRHAIDGVPHPIAGVEDHCLGTKATLAMAVTTISERGVDTRWVKLVHRIPERLAQQRRRIKDGVAGGVGEESKLVAIADSRAIQQSLTISPQRPALDCPAVGATIPVEPFRNFCIALTKPARRHADPYPHGKAPLRHRDDLARVAGHSQSSHFVL